MARVSQTEVVSEFMQFFWKNERPPSAKELSEIMPYDEAQIEAILTRPEVITSLSAFHMPDQTAKGLTPKQVVWANMIINVDDPRPMRKKAAEIGITMAQHNAWMNTPKFRNFVQSRAAKVFGQEKWQVYLSVLGNARSGDVQAQKLYLELIGDYQPSSRVDVNAKVDVNLFINQVLEIIQLRCTPEQIMLIADDLQAIQEGKTPPILSNPKEIIDLTPTRQTRSESAAAELMQVQW